MKSRYSTLRSIGTLALVAAWIILILGVIGAFATWFGLGGLARDLELPGSVGFAAAIPVLLGGIFGFLQFYILGKVLHLLVDGDDTQQEILAATKNISIEPAPDSAALEISGELKRQSKLIASTLESTEEIKTQVADLDTKVEAAVAPVDEVTTVVVETLDKDGEVIETDVVTEIIEALDDDTK
ncbi:MAG: hypothetical protein U9R25_01765 [Chloroflexota bacterium]|nr:hypothetical protein [Chloroflexota bacterium]